MWLVLVGIAALSAEICTYSTLFATHAANNDNYYYFDPRTYGPLIYPDPCTILPKGALRSKVGETLECVGEWCPLGAWGCSASPNLCYHTHRIILPRHADVSDCETNIAGNVIMAYVGWQPQSSCETRQVYGQLATDAKNHVLRCCGRPTPTPPASLPTSRPAPPSSPGSVSILSPTSRPTPHPTPWPTPNPIKRVPLAAILCATVPTAQYLVSTSTRPVHPCEATDEHVAISCGTHAGDPSSSSTSCYYNPVDGLCYARSRSNYICGGCDLLRCPTGQISYKYGCNGVESHVCPSDYILLNVTDTSKSRHCIRCAKRSYYEPLLTLVPTPLYVGYRP